MSTCFECLGLVHEEVRSQHHAITNNIHLAPLEDTRGNGAKHILLTFKLQCVASIGTTLKTSYHVVLRGQYIDHLTFSFVTPLQTEQDINFSLIHFFIVFCNFVLFSFARLVSFA